MKTLNTLSKASSKPSRPSFLVIGREKALVIQVLLAIRTAFPGAACVAACSRNARFLVLSNLCSSYLKIDFEGQDDDGFVDYANRHARATLRPLLVPVDCDGARMVGRVRQRLDADVIPCPDEAMIDCFDNKWRFYEFCVKHRLNAPRTCFVASKHELEFPRVAREIGIPFVVKPVAECATRGVEIVHDEKGLERTIVGNDAYRYAPLIVQRYVRGTDVGLNLLALQGSLKAVAVQQRAYPQHDGAEITFISNSYLEKVAHTVAKHSLYNGVMNIDARIEEGTGKVFLLESNPRFWRSLSASVWCGLNFAAECMDPPSRSGEIHRLISGRADTYFHPLLRSSMLRDAMFGNDHRGRMARLMMYDLCTLLGQMKETFKPGAARGRHDIDHWAASDLPNRTGW